MATVWASGTDSATKVKTEIGTWLKTFLTSRNVDPRTEVEAPEKERKRRPAPMVRIYTGADEQEPSQQGTGSGTFIAEWHRVTIDVIGDERAAPESAFNAIVSNIRQGLCNPTEQNKLIAKGVYNVQSTAEALDNGIVYTRPVTIICRTETLV